MAEPSSFTITQLTDNGEADLRGGHNIKLQGRALPYQPFTLEGKMRADFTWYPGHATASVQMLGAEEAPSTVNGMWKQKFLGQKNFETFADVSPTAVFLFDGQQVFDTVEACLAVDTLRLAGRLLKVKWDEQVRHGILLRFRQTWKRHEDVEWEMEFQWISRGDARQPLTFPLNPSAGDFAAQARTRINELTAALVAPFEVDQDFFNTASAQVQDIENAVSQVESTVAAVADKILSQVEAAQRTLAAAQTMVGSASQIVTLAERTPARAVVSTEDIAGISFGEAIEADTYTRGIKAAARKIAYLAAEQGDTLRATANQENLLAAFVARDAMDLREVASQFYGSPDGWRSLLQYNSLTSSRLTAGQLVLVPKVEFTSRGT